MAPGRGLRHHPGTSAISLACGGSRWRRHRYPRPASPFSESRQTIFPQAVEKARPLTSAVGYRQAEKLQYRSPRGHAVRRPLHRPVRKQPSGSLARADATTGTTDAEVQISATGATILDRAWARSKPLSRRTTFVASASSSRAPRSLFPRLGRRNVHRVTQTEPSFCRSHLLT